VTAVDTIKDSYKEDEDFSIIWDSCCNNNSPVVFRIEGGFLLKNNTLCIPNTSLRQQLISEAYDGGLAGHFGRDKSVKQLDDRFYWPGMRKATENMCKGAQSAKRSKELGRT